MSPLYCLNLLSKIKFKLNLKSLFFAKRCTAPTLTNLKQKSSTNTQKKLIIGPLRLYFVFCSKKSKNPDLGRGIAFIRGNP